MAEAAVAAKPEFTIERDPPFIRRFERPDIDKHAAWFVPRLLKAFPQFNERSAYTWLLNILTSNEYMFLYMDHGIALAQVVQYGLRPEAVIEEQFVWIEDPRDKEMQDDASWVYTHFHLWAVRKGLSTMIVGENSDVPLDLIGKTLEKKVLERKQAFVRVK